MRNIANVVHDLSPIVDFMKEKLLDLDQSKDLKEIKLLNEKIIHDVEMMERYIHALQAEAQKYSLVKENT